MIAPSKAPSFKAGKTLREAGRGWVGTARALGTDGLWFGARALLRGISAYRVGSRSRRAGDCGASFSRAWRRTALRGGVPAGTITVESGKGAKRREIPIHAELARLLSMHIGTRRAGPLFLSRQKGSSGSRTYVNRNKPEQQHDKQPYCPQQ